MITCRKCGEDKPPHEYHRRGESGRLRAECKPCTRTANLERYHNNPKTKEAHHRASRKHYLRKLYGLTVADYERMLTDRGHRCDICGNPEPRDRTLAVDHCHTTGKVRGLLCQACNTAIGKLRDDPTLIRRAAAYVEAHS